MTEAWYAILSFMLTVYVILEGFDIGAGMLQHVVGRSEADRRIVVAAIGPLWSWHEVWLLGFGGTLLLAFPTIFAVSFAGFYLAFFLLLWSLILRGVSIEVGGHINDPLWRTAWDFCFAASNILLAVLLGAALGNILRGVPLGPEGTFSLAFFTDFRPYGQVGILDWYTVSVAIFMVATFAAHGAIGLAQKTEGQVHERSLRIAGILWKIIPLLLAAITVETWTVRPALFTGMFHQPFAWLGFACVAGGLTLVFRGLRGRHPSVGFPGSALFIAGLTIAGAAGEFPIMLASTLSPDYALSAYSAPADAHSQAVAMVWWPLALLFSVGYFWFIFRHYSGKVKPAQDTQVPY